MSRKLAVYEPFLEKRHKEKMRAAAEKHGFEVRIVDNPEEERAFLTEIDRPSDDDSVLSYETLHDRRFSPFS